MSATALSKYLSDTRSPVDTPTLPRNEHERWMVKRMQELLVVKRIPYKNSALIGIVMKYTFMDRTTCLIRLHELLDDRIPSVLMSLIRLHGRIISITAPDDVQV